MNKAGFIGSMISVLLGAMIMVTTSIINEMIPKMGYLAFKSQASGSYSPSDYVMNFAFANTVAAILVVGGLILGVYCFKSKTRTK